MKDKPIVMVVEDDAEMNELQCELLAVNGLDSVAAYDGRQALDAFEDTGKPDAVLLDLMLPEMDGFETCRKIREKFNRHLPIVMVTALDNDDCRKKGFEAGADAYFTKPFDPDEIIQTLQLLIKTNPQNNNC